MKLFLGMMLIGCFANANAAATATVYNCKIEENFQVVEKVQVTASEEQRVKVSSRESYVFYLSTFTKNLVELETFLPSVEMRIYSKGNIEKNSVTLTSWQRDGLIEFTCSIASN